MKLILCIGLFPIIILGTKNRDIRSYTFQKVLIDSTKREFRDPVCGMKLRPKSTTTIYYLHEKISYSFCSEVCKKKFISHPAPYLKKK